MPNKKQGGAIIENPSKFVKKASQKREKKKKAGPYVCHEHPPTSMRKKKGKQKTRSTPGKSQREKVKKDRKGVRQRKKKRNGKGGTSDETKKVARGRGTVCRWVGWACEEPGGEFGRACTTYG